MPLHFHVLCLLVMLETLGAKGKWQVQNQKQVLTVLVMVGHLIKQVITIITLEMFYCFLVMHLWHLEIVCFSSKE